MHRISSFTTVDPKYYWMVCSVLIAVLSVGCGGRGRQAIEGTVTLDGQPLQQGYIRLQPQPGTSSPAAGAPVEGGVFSIACERGVFAGKYFVEITAMRPSGRMLIDPDSGQSYQEKIQVLPARYNKATELTVAVVEGAPTPFEFELDSK